MSLRGRIRTSYDKSHELVEMAISTDPKPTIYRNFYEKTGPDPWLMAYKNEMKWIGL